MCELYPSHYRAGQPLTCFPVTVWLWQVFYLYILELLQPLCRPACNHFAFHCGTCPEESAFGCKPKISPRSKERGGTPAQWLINLLASCRRHPFTPGAPWLPYPPSLPSCAVNWSRGSQIKMAEIFQVEGGEGNQNKHMASLNALAREWLN